MDKKGICIAVCIAATGFLFLALGSALSASPEQRQSQWEAREARRAEQAQREQRREQEKLEMEEARQKAEDERWGTNDKKQPERKALINNLVESGVFRKVDLDKTRATVWVDSTFYALDFEEKQAFSSLVYAYIVVSTRCEMSDVQFKDIQTGKVVAQHTYFRDFRMN